jgi:TolB-like protein/Tfp pilus assembly protein PilF
MRQRSWPIALFLIGPLAVLVAMLFVAKFPGLRRNRPTTKVAMRSIAVLPFENLSGDPDQEYLADGIADALLTNLAQIHSLRVISRASTLQYRGTRKSLPQIARELNVDALVEGTFSSSGNRVRITGQLIEAATDQHLWAEVYERNVEDLLRLQSEIALNIAARISATLSSEEQLRLAMSRPTQPDAQEAYLRGRYLLSLRGGENLVRAPYYFQLAVDKDPTFAEAYAGLAEPYSTLAGWGLIKGEDADAKIGAAAVKAVQLDNNSSAAHTALASYNCTLKDREGIEREIRCALQLNPSNSTAHKIYGLYLHLTGDLDGAIAEETTAQDLDPLSAHLRLSLGHVLYDAKQFDRAIVHFQKAIELDPEFHFLYLNIGWSYAHQGLHEAAVNEWSRHWAHTPAVAVVLNRAYEKPGYRGYLKAELGQEFAKAFRPMAWSNYQRAVIYATAFRTELENRAGDAKGKGTSGRPTRPKVPMHWPGAHCFVVAENGKPEELLVLMEGGSLL